MVLADWEEGQEKGSHAKFVYMLVTKSFSSKHG